jgi:hypothetical protein
LVWPSGHAGYRKPPVTASYAWPGFVNAGNARRNTMAKGQQRGNKETKKPKKEKQVVLPAGTFITPPKVILPHKPKH